MNIVCRYTSIVIVAVVTLTQFSLASPILLGDKIVTVGQSNAYAVHGNSLPAGTYSLRASTGTARWIDRNGRTGVISDSFKFLAHPTVLVRLVPVHGYAPTVTVPINGAPVTVTFGNTLLQVSGKDIPGQSVSAVGVRPYYAAYGVIQNGYTPVVLDFNLSLVFEDATGKTYKYDLRMEMPVINPTAWIVNEVGVSASSTLVACPAVSPGEWSSCDPLRLTFSSGYLLNVTGHLPAPRADCSVRVGSAVMSGNPVIVASTPANLQFSPVEETSADVPIQVRCLNPGGYQIPVVFQQRYQ